MVMTRKEMVVRQMPAKPTTRLAIRLAALALLTCGAAQASAQIPNLNPARQYNRGAGNPGAQYLRRSSGYSPYLNLLQNQGGLTGAVPNYQSFVRPQLQQQRQNAQVNRSIQGIQGNVANLQAGQAGGQAAGINGVRATGRGVGQTNLSSYYNNRLQYFSNLR